MERDWLDYTSLVIATLGLLVGSSAIWTIYLGLDERKLSRQDRIARHKLACLRLYEIAHDASRLDTDDSNRIPELQADLSTVNLTDLFTTGAMAAAGSLRRKLGILRELGSGPKNSDQEYLRGLVSDFIKEGTATRPRADWIERV